KARLQVLRALGVTFDIPVQLTDALSFKPAAALTLHEALAAAHESLPELRAQQKNEESAALNHRATVLERAPSVVGFADYGSIGESATDNSPTRTFGVSVRIPIFDGGRREARRTESMSVLKQERIRSADLEKEVELKIRVAMDALESAAEQVHAAEEALSLSN